MECIENYEHYVVKGGMTLDEYVALSVRIGQGKLSRLRQGQLSAALAASYADQIEDGKLTEAALKATIMNGNRPHDNEVIQLQWISRSYRFTPDEDAIVQEAIAHIRSRAKGRNISDSMAISYACSEYLNQFGFRNPK
jgi:hypothetical protein